MVAHGLGPVRQDARDVGARPGGLDWVHGNVEFGYQFARPTKTAYDVCDERQGVCRDFQHLAITFCAPEHPGAVRDGLPRRHRRAAAAPPDGLLGWFEVYLGGAGTRSTPATTSRGSAAC